MALTKLPRKGTRVRAVFDRLYKDFTSVKNTSWASAKAAYDNAPPAYPLKAVPLNRMPGFSNPRVYSGMDVSRCLKKYAKRVARGQYEMKAEWVALADKEIPPTPPKVKPPIFSEKIDGTLKDIGRMVPRECTDPKCPICPIFKGSNLKPIAHTPITSENVRIDCKCGKVRLETPTSEIMQFGGYFHSRTKCTEPSNPFANITPTSIPGKIPLTSLEDAETTEAMLEAEVKRLKERVRELLEVTSLQDRQIKDLENKIKGLEAQLKIATGSRDGYLKAADDRINSQRIKISELAGELNTERSLRVGLEMKLKQIKAAYDSVQ